MLSRVGRAGVGGRTGAELDDEDEDSPLSSPLAEDAASVGALRLSMDGRDGDEDDDAGLPNAGEDISPPCAVVADGMTIGSVGEVGGGGPPAVPVCSA